MNKIITVAALALVAISRAGAQAPYTLSNYWDPYESLTHATSANGTTDWMTEGTNLYTIPMPFYAKIGATNTNTLYYEGDDIFASDDFTSTSLDFFQFVFTSLTVDRGYPGATSMSPIRYATSGCAPHRIFKLEAANDGIFNTTTGVPFAGDFFNTQLWVYEGSDIVEIHFGASSFPHAHSGAYFGSFMVPSDSPAFVGYMNANVAAGMANFGWLASGNPSHPSLAAFNAATPNYPNYVTPLWHWPASGTVYRFTPVKTAKHCGKSAEGSEPATGIGQLAGGNIRIYPNPAQHAFYVAVPVSDQRTEIVVTDLSGKVTDSRTIAENSGMPVEFDLGNRPAGIYIVTISTGAETYTGKILVQ